MALASVVTYTYGGNVLCSSISASQYGNHGLSISGTTGIFDYLAAPVNVEVDWDDGSGSSDYVDSSYGFNHVYGNSGLRHVKVYTEGTDGGYCLNSNPRTVDVWVN